MNSLSWMIYLAGVTESVSDMLMVALILCGLAAIASGIAWMVNADCGDDDIADAARKFLFRIPRVAIPAALAFSILPSSNTVYAIAASEMGETALKSETGGKAVKALNAWLDHQIAGDAKKDDAK